MKKCGQCGKPASDNQAFCIHCGFNLGGIKQQTSKPKPSNQNMIIAIVVIGVIVFVFGLSLNEQRKEEEFEEYLAMTEYLNDTSDYSSQPTNSDLKIESGWTWRTERNYTYIEGSVTNVGESDINYFEVRADYLDDAGYVFDSDYTNDGQTLRPGESRKFEIMHEDDDEIKSATLSVEEVK